ncbi:MAG: penicillin acylase family protein [Geminicoccaceae bacterium]
MRLDALPQTQMPLEKPVQVHWNEHHVPFIHAQTDRDLAFALGVVHHHLRAGQMRLLKQISQGRLSEIAGPFAHDIDRSLRMLGFGRSSADVVAAWPDDTRLFVDAFVAGLNWHQAQTAKPPEFGLLGLRDEVWTPEDLVTVGRLAGTDVTWLAAFGALEARLAPDWPQTWQRLRVAGHGIPPIDDLPDPESDDQPTEQAVLENLLGGLSRSGSNSLVIGPSRSKKGAPLIANDPHLGLNLPNLWLLAGVKSPSYHAVGMMIPGLPFIALGRSQTIAWGGTNARASSSDLVDVDALPTSEIEVREEKIKTRLWRDARVDVRLSPFGPVISDSRFVQARPGETLALKWVGHGTSDEITAFLRAMRAENVEAFREAFRSYGVSAQNMLVVDRDGRIAKLMAAWLPKRSHSLDSDLVVEPPANGALWNGVDTALDMAWLVDPESGFIASANDRPDYINRPAGYFFSPSDRIDRMATLVRDNGKIDVAALQSIQTDVSSASARGLANKLVECLESAGINHPSVGQLAEWDGGYGEDSQGAVVFETVLYHITRNLYGRGPEKVVSRVDGAWGSLILHLVDDLSGIADEERKQLLQEAVDEAASDAANHANWGEMHRVKVQHILGNVPVVGRFFQLNDLPTAGSRETLMKRSHNLVRERHNASFGAQARHISDMAEDDANWFVLFGGQDGWLGSTTFSDQVELWRDGAYVHLPLQPETIARSFPHKQEWRPDS